MKTKRGLIILLAVILFQSNVFSQTNSDTIGNFISNNGSVYWSHKFDNKLNFRSFLISLKKENIIAGIDTFNNTIIGQLNDVFMDYRGAGYTTMSAPIFISSSSCKASVIIEKSDTNYIVTIKKIIFVNQNDTKLISPLLGSAQGESTPLEDYAIKKTGKFRKTFIKPSADIINHTFLKIFEIK